MKPLAADHPAVSPQTHSDWPACPPPARLRVPLTQLGPHDCPYLPGRVARDRAFLTADLAPGAYHGLMDAGFRRSGGVVYQPTCRGCRACRPVRVGTGDFEMTKRLRRCRNRNADLSVTAGDLEPTREKFELYRRYQAVRHGEHDRLDWPSFVDFLYDSPVETVEFQHRDPAGRLLAVGICDACPRSLSSVYFYYDPLETRRGLGTFGVIEEIAWCRANGVPWYYLGFWVAGCAAMAYKATFRPCQILGTDGVWRDLLAVHPAPDAPSDAR